MCFPRSVRRALVVSLVVPAAAAAGARMRARLAERGLVGNGPLAIGPVAANTARLGQWGKLELAFDAGGTYDNPFDPRQIDVRAEIAPPSGKRHVVPAFFYQEFRRTAKDFERVGAPLWKVRFAPTEIGIHGYRVVATNRGATAASPRATFECTPRKGRGYVRISKANPLSYQFDGGEPYFPSGINLFVWSRLGEPLPTDRLDLCERWMSRLAEHEGNFVRLRMDSWWLAIEMTPDEAAGYLGLGYYHQRACWEIDRIYGLAAKLGIHVMHCLDNANGSVNASRQSWRRPYDLYLAENGGVCDKPEDFWSHPEARRSVRNKLRYCAARWGWHPHLMCWEFWNEVACRATTIDAAAAWHRDMARYLRSVDPSAHPITTSLMGDRALAHRIWDLPEIEIVQHHYYGRAGLATPIAQMTQEAVRRYKKPFFLGEYGIGRDFRPGTAPYDARGVNVHNGLWAATFAQGSGAGAPWYIKDYLDARDLYGHYRALARFTRRVPWNRADLRPCTVDVPEVEARPTESRYVDLPIPVSTTYAFKRPPKTDFVIQPDGSFANADMLRGMLHCQRARKAPPTFHVTLDRPGKFTVAVSMSVGDETNKLLISLDGKRVAEQPFPAGKQFNPKSEHVEAYNNWRTPYRKSVAIDVPAGRHAIRPEAVGKDRLEVRYVLEGAVAFSRSRPLRAMGLRTDTAAWLWLRNRSSNWRTLYDNGKVIPIPGATTNVRGLPDGSYRIEWWDTWAGTTSATADAASKGGILHLNIPAITHDVACLISPR